MSLPTSKLFARKRLAQDNEEKQREGEHDLEPREEDGKIVSPSVLATSQLVTRTRPGRNG